MACECPKIVAAPLQDGRPERPGLLFLKLLLRARYCFVMRRKGGGAGGLVCFAVEWNGAKAGVSKLGADSLRECAGFPFFVLSFVSCSVVGFGLQGDVGNDDDFRILGQWELNFGHFGGGQGRFHFACACKPS